MGCMCSAPIIRRECQHTKNASGPMIDAPSRKEGAVATVMLDHKQTEQEGRGSNEDVKLTCVARARHFDDCLSIFVPYWAQAEGQGADPFAPRLAVHQHGLGIVPEAPGWPDLGDRGFASVLHGLLLEELLIGPKIPQRGSNLLAFLTFGMGKTKCLFIISFG
jgi:hypothetical protein